MSSITFFLCNEQKRDELRKEIVMLVDEQNTLTAKNAQLRAENDTLSKEHLALVLIHLLVANT
jgi:hypothetical protein